MPYLQEAEEEINKMVLILLSLINKFAKDNTNSKAILALPKQKVHRGDCKLCFKINLVLRQKLKLVEVYSAVTGRNGVCFLVS